MHVQEKQDQPKRRAESKGTQSRQKQHHERCISDRRYGQDTYSPYAKTIAKENTHLGPKLKLVSIVLAETRPASTPKNPKGGVVGLNMKQTEQRCVLVENRSGHTVDEVTCRKKSLIPNPKWKRGVRKQGKTGLDQMSVFALGNTVLLRGMWT